MKTWGALAAAVAAAASCSGTAARSPAASAAAAGLPDPDADGVTSDADLCPDDAEDPDGFEDHDGCPEPDNDQDRIYFEPGSAQVRAISVPIVSALAAAIERNQDMERVACVGRASRAEPRPEELSLARARSVCRLVAERGVAASRLESHGLGTADPLTPDQTDEDHERERNVELMVMVRGGVVRARWNGRTIERVTAPSP